MLVGLLEALVGVLVGDFLVGLVVEEDGIAFVALLDGV
jgi:hypothetical protein